MFYFLKGLINNVFYSLLLFNYIGLIGTTVLGDFHLILQLP